MFGDETHRHDQNITHATLAIAGNDFACGRSQPFHGTDLALKRQFVGIPAAEPIHDALDGSFRLIQVRVSLANKILRDAVCAEQDLCLVRVGEFTKFFLNGR